MSTYVLKYIYQGCIFPKIWMGGMEKGQENDKAKEKGKMRRKEEIISYFFPKYQIFKLSLCIQSHLFWSKSTKKNSLPRSWTGTCWSAWRIRTGTTWSRSASRPSSLPPSRYILAALFEPGVQPRSTFWSLSKASEPGAMALVNDSQVFKVT